MKLFKKIAAQFKRGIVAPLLTIALLVGVWIFRSWSPVSTPIEGVKVELADTATLNLIRPYYYCTPEQARKLKITKYKKIVPEDVASVMERKVTLQKGDSVRVMAYDRTHAALWVETAEGRRGLIAAEAVSRNWQVYDVDGKDSMNIGEPLSFVSRELKYPFHITATDSLGKTITRDVDQVAPAFIVPHDRHFYYEDAYGDIVCSRRSFEKAIAGKTQQEVDSMYVPAMVVSRDGNKTYAAYNVSIYDDGIGAFFKPIVCFGDGKAEIANRGKSAGIQSWIVKVLPFNNFVIDKFGWLIASPGFDVYSQHFDDRLFLTKPSAAKLWTTAILLIIFVLLPLLVGFFLFWGMMYCIPAIVLYILLNWPWPLKPLSNRIVMIVTIALLLSGFYVWLVLMMAYDNDLWPAVVLMMMWAFTFIMDKMACLLSLRCEKCAHIDSYVYDHTDWGEAFDRWEDETESRQTDSKLINKFRTWTEVITTTTTNYGYYTDKHVSTSRIDEKTHRVYKDSYQHDYYKVLYHVEPYKDFHKCKHCKNIHVYNGEKKTELDRKHTGRSFSTDTHESVTNGFQ